MYTGIITDPNFRKLVLETLGELDSLSLDGDILKWVIFTATIQSKLSYTVSRNLW